MTNPTNRDWRTAGYVLTPSAFREAHPDLASRAWVEEADGRRFICWRDLLANRTHRIQCDVPLCECCDGALDDGFCAECEAEERWLERTGTGGWL